MKPALQDIDTKIGAIGELREKPAGLVRITAAAAIAIKGERLPPAVLAFSNIEAPPR